MLGSLLRVLEYSSQSFEIVHLIADLSSSTAFLDSEFELFRPEIRLERSIAALAAAPLLASGAAFAGPYVNLEATGSYPDGAYSSGGLEAVVGYEGETANGIGWYVSGGPTVTHTETADEFGDVEFIGYLGGSYDKFYGEISGVTAEDDVNWAAKAGVKFTF